MGQTLASRRAVVVTPGEPLADAEGDQHVSPSPCRPAEPRLTRTTDSSPSAATAAIRAPSLSSTMNVALTSVDVLPSSGTSAVLTNASGTITLPSPSLTCTSWTTSPALSPVAGAWPAAIVAPTATLPAVSVDVGVSIVVSISWPLRDARHARTARRPGPAASSG